MAHFGLSKLNFLKKEIDISISDKDTNDLETVIELKFPRNGQYPEQMFNFCKDISFTEQLVLAGCKSAFVIIIVDERPFYEGNHVGIYSYFRGGNSLSGIIQKPTGKRDSECVLNGSYNIKWYEIRNNLRYAIIQANPQVMDYQDI